MGESWRDYHDREIAIGGESDDARDASVSLKPIAHFDAASRELTVTAPTAELHTLGHGIPGARERKGSWVAPATPATVARIIKAFGRENLEPTRSFRAYEMVSLHRLRAARDHARAAEWPPIPLTALQPEGEWMHQRKAFWVAHSLEACMLAVTMGGGKTKTAIDLIQNWKAKKVLVISPLAACEDAWLPQLEKYMLRRYIAGHAFVGSSKKRMEEIQIALDSRGAQHQIVLINHEAFWREPYAGALLAQEWDLIIPDEIHREKSAGSRSSKFLHRLAARAHRRLGLTGTLFPHSPLDAYGQYRFLDQGLFGTSSHAFKQEYGTATGYQFREVEFNPAKQRQLTRKIRTITLVVDDSEQGLPALVPLEHRVALLPEVRRVYKQVDDEFIADVGGGEATVANSGVKLMRLHQIASGLLKLDDGTTQRIGTEKISAVVEILGDLKDDEPVVIFTRFQWDTEDVAKRLRHYTTVSVMSGKLHQLQDWKAEKSRILVAQIQTVKEGTDLTRAAYGIFYSTGISLGDYQQCVKRLHRPPQRRAVRLIHILAKGTRDVSTYRALRDNRDVVQAVLEDIKNGR